MFLNNRLLLGELVLLVFITIISSMMLPHIALYLIISYCVIYYSIKFLYGKLNGKEIIGHWVLLVLTLIMSTGITANIWEFTIVLGGTLENPVLVNCDSRRYYNFALLLYQGLQLPGNVAYIGYPYLIMMVWKITGVNVVAPILLNMFLTLLSVVISGEISKRLLKDMFPGSFQKIGGLAVLMTGMVCYYIGSGMVILKESAIFIGFALSGYSIMIFKENNPDRNKIIRDLLLFAIGSVIVAFTRATYCYLLIVAVVLFSSYYKKLKLGGLFIIVILILFTFGLYFSTSGIERHVNVVFRENMITDNYLKSGQQPYVDIIGDYFSYSFIERSLLLPLSAAVQYLIPFPWNFMRDVPFGYSMIYSHISYGWYMVGGFILFYYLFAIWKSDSKLICWSLWTLFCYLMPAYMFAGSVSRYMLPFVPLLVPAGVYVVMRLKENRYRRSFRYWIYSYCITLFMVLCLCYYLQVVR